MRLSNDWKDYELIDAGNGEKLENWNGVILRRPDPQAIWPVENIDEIWKIQMDYIIGVIKAVEAGILKEN